MLSLSLSVTLSLVLCNYYLPYGTILSPAVVPPFLIDIRTQSVNVKNRIFHIFRHFAGAVQGGGGARMVYDVSSQNSSIFGRVTVRHVCIHVYLYIYIYVYIYVYTYMGVSRVQDWQGGE